MARITSQLVYHLALGSHRFPANGCPVINAYVYIGAANLSIIANSYENTAAIAYPPILANFTAIGPQYGNTMRITNLTDLTIELGAGTPNGQRQMFGTATFGNSVDMFQAAYDIFNAGFAPFYTVAGFQTSFVLQPVSRAILRASAAAGGNSLGLNVSEGDLVILDMTIAWTDATADAGINAAAKQIVIDVQAKAKALGVYNDL